MDAALRHVTHALLRTAAADGSATAEASAVKIEISPGLDPRAMAAALGYLRDRISVPRDMSYPAARQLRIHLNWGIEAVGKAASFS